MKFIDKLIKTKKYIERLERNNKDLQVKLDKTRECAKCNECKDRNCFSNPYTIHTRP